MTVGQGFVCSARSGGLGSMSVQLMLSSLLFIPLYLLFIAMWLILCPVSVRMRSARQR